LKPSARGKRCSGSYVQPIEVLDSIRDGEEECLKERLLKETDGLESVVGVGEEGELVVEVLDGAEETVDAIEGLWEPLVEARESRDESGGVGARLRDTIFIPRLVLVVAGMNNVVRLFGAGIAIR